MGTEPFRAFPGPKKKKKSPAQIAKNWAAKLQKVTLPEMIQKIQAEGPYLNFFARTEWLARETIEAIELKPSEYGFVSSNGKKAVIEFSSPNIAKPFSIGHLRSTNLGASLSRIFSARGWDVVRINHLGDWGTQFGKVISAYRHWGKAEELDQNPMHYLYELYVKFHEEEKENANLTEEAREWFAKLEQGDEEATELWKWFKDLSLSELDKLYQELGVEFDHFIGESFYVDQLPEVFDQLTQSQLMKTSDNAEIIDLKDYKLGVSVVKKSDESSLYITRDLAAAIYRKKTFEFDEMIYVVGVPQQLHFQQLFKILELLQMNWSSQCEHVAFGHMSLGDQKMSTRKGTVVFLRQVLDEAIEKADQTVSEKNPELENRGKVAKQVALGAILFADISSRRVKDVKFSWDEILSFDGETGPYLQYSLVRTKSLIQRFEEKDSSSGNVKHLKSEEEGELIRLLASFPDEIAKAEREREPFVLGQFLIQLSKSFNRFYTKHRVLDAEGDLALARIRLVKATSKVLEIGLKLLGIPTPDKM